MHLPLRLVGVAGATISQGDWGGEVPPSQYGSTINFVDIRAPRLRYPFPQQDAGAVVRLHTHYTTKGKWAEGTICPRSGAWDDKGCAEVFNSPYPSPASL